MSNTHFFFKLFLSPFAEDIESLDFGWPDVESDNDSPHKVDLESESFFFFFWECLYVLSVRVECVCLIIVGDVC